MVLGKNWSYASSTYTCISVALLCKTLIQNENNQAEMCFYTCIPKKASHNSDDKAKVNSFEVSDGQNSEII